MKKHFCILLFMLLSANVFADDWNIKMVHFVPTDQQSTAQERANIKKFTEDAQTFYKEQMQKHGHGQKTFQLDPKVYVVNGKLKARQYTSPTVFNNDLQALTRQHGQRHGYVIFIDIENLTGFGCGYAYKWGNGGSTGNIYGGRAYIAYSKSCLLKYKHMLVAHEIGHIFALEHDINITPATFMNVNSPPLMTKQQADWLSVSHYFQGNRKFGKAPLLKKSHGIMDRHGDYTITIAVQDDSGLHSAQLWYNHRMHWYKLDDEFDIITFTTDNHNSVANRLNMNVIDKNGNLGWYKIPTSIDERHEPIAEPEPEPEKRKPANVFATHKLATIWAAIKSE